MSDNRPIGVFDSGIGGLTVLKELCEHFQNENFVYLGDTARLPYGSKSPDTIRRYSEQNIEYLRKQHVKAIVIACNSASTQVHEPEIAGLPIYNVITPGAKRALQLTQNNRIGVLGTRATILSKAYTEKIHALNPKVDVFSQACPLFVPLAEEGWDNDPVTNLIVFRYLQPVMQNHVDTLILGCTHYPILKNSIYKVTGSSVELVDSGTAIADWLKEDFNSGRLQTSDTKDRHIDIMTTDSSEHFAKLGARILAPNLINTFNIVNI